MRIKPPAKIAHLPVKEQAEYLADKWAGRTLGAWDLRTIYGITEKQAGAILLHLKRMDAIDNAASHGEGVTTWRLRA
jgi:hypothetical protein